MQYIPHAKLISYPELERYGEGRLAPAIDSPKRGEFLQWIHYAEATAYPPPAVIIWHTMYRQDTDEVPEIIEDASERAHTLGADSG